MSHPTGRLGRTLTQKLLIQASTSLLAIVVVGALSVGPAAADTTPIQVNPSEPSLDQPGGILDQLYGLNNLVRIHDSNADPIDQLWTIMGPAGATATAKFAGLTEDFGFLPGESPSASFTSLFVVGGSGFVAGPTASFGPAQTGSTFRFALNPSSGDLWSTLPSDNTDGYDHMVTWQIVSSDAAHPSNPIGSYAVAWEDLPVPAPPAPTDPEPDYNDLVIEFSDVAPAVCGDGIVSDGETCDDGNTVGGDCCSATCQIEPAGGVCRASSGPCDAAESCDGVSGACPADQLEAAGTVCRAAVDVCDAAELCDGLAAGCPPDLPASAGTSCRPVAGPCDQEELCDGATVSCPADAFLATGTTCRPSAGACDVAELCDGTNAACPTDAVEASGTSCRPAVGACDVAELCDGTSPTCPADAVAGAGTLCRGPAGACDVAELCDGTSGLCPPDGLLPAGSTCRASAGACDLAETCDGLSSVCGPDAVEPAGTVCHPSVDLCDQEEVCDGVLASCPPDQLAAAGTVCRASAFACDAEEVCDGLSQSCPVDGILPDGSTCDADPCTTDQCVAGSCQVTPLPPSTPPPADFIFVIDASVSMRRDFKQWLPAQLETFPAALAAAGIDYELAIVRFGTDRRGKRKLGPPVPDVVLPCTNDPAAFDAALDRMMRFNLRRCSEDPNDPTYLDCIRNSTESGSEGIRFALEDPSRLGCRPGALRNVLLYTDEDDDSPALDANGNLNAEKREPPSRGIKCYGRRCESRWVPFQQRTDDTAALLISQRVQLNIIQKTRNSPSKNQYGDPACTRLDPNGNLDPAATMSCLIQPDRLGFTPKGTCDPGTSQCLTGRKGQACASDADCDAFGLQLHLLASGVCGGGGTCIGGKVGSACSADADCSILARAYEVPRNATEAIPFFQNDLIPDKIREQRCP